MPTFPYSTPRAWSELLTQSLQRPVEVRFGRARRQVIVVQERGEAVSVRMNGIFGEAPLDVASAVAQWMRSGRRARRACSRLDEWIAEIEPLLKPGRKERLRTAGEHYELRSIMKAVVDAEFTNIQLGNPAPRITWGRRSTSRAYRSLQLGSYDCETGIIRIHAVLDQSAVPLFFVRYVVFHELLHAALGDEPAPPKGRRPHHGPRFRRMEEAYAGYERAIEWQKANIRALMRSARSAKPMKRSVGVGPKQLWLF